MPDKYEQVTEDIRRRILDEFDDIGEFLSEQLYSKRTHFIFELLQNAEDAYKKRVDINPQCKLPKNVTFRLFNNRLEVSHFGQPFDENYVRAISNVLRGTKKADFNQIGNFGIGFKSVYAFTSSPEIHSGEEHFKIESYIRPRAVEPVNIQEGETLFIFPFDHKKLKPQEAFEIIGDKLRNLEPNILLFLRYIERIEWSIAGGSVEFYRRKVENHNLARRISIISQNEDEKERWLLFDRPVPLPEDQGTVRVEAAFRLVQDQKTGREYIERVDDSFLSIFFATKVRTGLGFIIQGPYTPTATRENIQEDNEWNKRLVKETAMLIVHSLHELKKMVLLTVSMLETLPIRVNEFPEGGMFRPLFDAVRDALTKQPLLPTIDGSFVRAKQAKFGDAKLRELFDGEQLRTLFNSSEPLKWLSDEMSKTSDLYNYIRSLGVEEIDYDFMARRITLDFIIKQSDEWMVKFYIYLSQHEPLWRAPRWSGDSPGPLRNREFIRLEGGRHVKPFREDGFSNVYLPPAYETDFPIVKRGIAANDQVQAFLEKLKIPQIDDVAEVVKNVLPKYGNEKSPILSDDEHLQDISKIRLALKIDSQEKKRQLENALKETRIVRAANALSGARAFMKPDEIYIRSRELEVYFEDNQDVWFLDSIYDEETVRCFEILRVSASVRVTCGKPDRGYVSVRAWYCRHKYNRGLDGFDPDCTIDGLEHALAHRSVERSTYIWNKLAFHNVQHICGIVESSSNKHFNDSEKKECISKMGRLVVEAAWLPNQNGEFHKPSELNLEDLPESFRRDERLAKALGMKLNEVAMLAQKVGVELHVIQIAKKLTENPALLQEMESRLIPTNHRPEFPVKTPSKLERREEKIRNDFQNAPEKAYEVRERSVRISCSNVDPATWLRDHYTNDQRQLICQICEQEMPFKKRNGEYYFEKVEIFNDCGKEYAQLRLALCPVCSAKYKEFVKDDSNGEMQKIKSSIMNGDSLSVPVCLEKDSTVRFVETHFNDLKTILREMFCFSASD